jgi:hypothetical protein
MIAMVTLWILAILSVIAVGMGYRVGIDLKISSYNLNQVKAINLAKSGVYKAIAELKFDRSQNEVDYLSESWNNTPEMFEDIELGSGKFRVGYPADSEGASSEEDWIFGVVDEERKINVYQASEETLERLSQVGIDASHIIADDNFPQLFPMNIFSGAEVDADELDAARIYLTIFGDGKININTASREVLSVLGMMDGLAERIIDYRAGPDGLEGTHDDTPFSEMESVADKLNEFGELTPEEHADLSFFIRTEVFTVKSRFFRIDSTGFLEDGTVSRKVTAVLERTDENSTIIRSWYES